ncbi:MAG: hypothetical protein PHY41_02005 [Candidatus Cloacimonetes bacterium]|jgi:G:T/U-mismatch repair DNA glycosylase|nr:hypothetical protein [Candidatus Cloacimonadota bacterium]MDY0299885.1 hypothetical protein [Candidatus Cloacimonadaceae bacterium]MCK9332430.1 hypothetical protein [Candidatus Cloacimonadota bacterium]MDD2211226.1 hypothetical protein [Candidatus Cloacimonadota bacterium]MDD3282243.1 hypothetical protein [Candidatus Cloacimonadota bacterium]
MLERQKHPFHPYIPKGAQALIIGTAPPWNFCTCDSNELREGEIDFFYGSINNLFWYIMKAVFEPNNPRWLRTRLHCQGFLKRHHLAMGDILQSFVRKDRKAADDHLSGFTYNCRILSLLASDNHKIRHLFFTSQLAHTLFLKSLKKHKYIYHIRGENRSHKSYLINIQKKGKAYIYNCLILNSPSPRINRSLEEMVEDYSLKFAVLNPHEMGNE